MADLNAEIAAKIEEEEQRAKGVLALFGHPIWPAQKHEIRRAERDLRGLAEDRDILARHKAIEWYEGDVGCWYCSGETDASHRAVDYPCPDVASLARRHGVEVPDA